MMIPSSRLLCALVALTAMWFMALPAVVRGQDRVLFVVTNHEQLGSTGLKTGYYLSEVSHPYWVLSDAGYEIDFASPLGGPAPMDPRSRDLDDPKNHLFYQNAGHRAALAATLPPTAIDPARYRAIYFAGGHGTMWDFPRSEELARITARIYENGGVVAAVCHGPAALVNVKLSDGSYLVAGKRVAAFTNEEEFAVGLHEVVPFLLATRLEQRGATHTSAPNFEAHVEVDGLLVTGQNPASATGVGEAMVRLLKETTTEDEQVATPWMSIPFEDMEGNTRTLSEFAGRAVLVVNTASKCGLTPQYSELEELHRKYREKGFTVLAFPSNDFGNQEPGTNDQILAFCQENYDVTFPVMAKMPVRGDDKSPLYRSLTESAPETGEISWNFEKFLIDPHGRIAARFSPRTKPSAPEVVAAIEKALPEQKESGT